MKQDRYYIVRKCVPVKNSLWKAKTVNENYVANNLNELLLKAITPEEISKGVKIFSILTSTDGVYFERIKSFK